MPAVDYDYITYPEKGGLTRNRKRIFSHTMPGSAAQALLTDTIVLHASHRIDKKLFKLEVRLTNEKAGHDVPTDSPLRHMILLVEARDAAGNPLTFSSGPILPDYCGKDADPERDYNG